MKSACCNAAVRPHSVIGAIAFWLCSQCGSRRQDVHTDHWRPHQ